MCDDVYVLETEKVCALDAATRRGKGVTCVDIAHIFEQMQGKPLFFMDSPGHRDVLVILKKNGAH